MRNLKTAGGLTHGSGMTETQRNQWTLSMPVCAEVHNTIQEISNTKIRTGEQNKDFGPSRIERDWKDTNLVRDYFKERNPFEYGPELCNIANGVHAHASVNVDDAEVIGKNILSGMVGKNVTEISFKRKDQAVTLASKTSVKVGETSIQFDPQVLFQRLALAGYGNIENAFDYELCQFPPALAESPDFLNEPQKANFADALWTSVSNKDVAIPKESKYVIDGGALLHRIPWTCGATFSSIIDSHTNYVLKKYGKAVVVFDGYTAASTKDMAHKRRAKGKQGPTVSFTNEMVLTVAKDVFLSNFANKQNFLQQLGNSLQVAGCEVYHALSDADVLIAQKAIESATELKTVLVGDDTDLLVLLLHQTKDTSNDLFFAPEPKKNAKRRVWDIKKAKKDIGPFVCQHILFLHALLGCDTTSRLFGIGKAAVLKKFKTNTALQQAAKVFDNDSAEPGQIESAGEIALVVMYNGKKNQSLNELRLSQYCEKVAKSLNRVEATSLPPTKAAAKFHSYRVYLQICQWKNPRCTLKEESWGWMLTDSGYSPILTDLPPAPAELLKIIRCDCTTDCSSARCSCCKNGMKCTLSCGHCQGSGCTNASALILEEEDLEEEDLEVDIDAE
jgi:hypothetical protein